MFDIPFLLLLAQTFLHICAMANPRIAAYIKKVSGAHLHLTPARCLVEDSKDLAFLVAVCGGRISRDPSKK